MKICKEVHYSRLNNIHNEENVSTDRVGKFDLIPEAEEFSEAEFSVFRVIIFLVDLPNCFVIFD